MLGIFNSLKLDTPLISKTHNSLTIFAVQIVLSAWLTALDNILFFSRFSFFFYLYCKFDVMMWMCQAKCPLKLNSMYLFGYLCDLNYALGIVFPKITVCCGYCFHIKTVKHFILNTECHNLCAPAVTAHIPNLPASWHFSGWIECNFQVTTLLFCNHGRK